MAKSKPRGQPVRGRSNGKTSGKAPVGNGRPAVLELSEAEQKQISTAVRALEIKKVEFANHRGAYLAKEVELAGEIREFEKRHQAVIDNIVASRDVDPAMRWQFQGDKFVELPQQQQA